MGTTITLTAPGATVVITGEGVYQGPTYDKLEGWYGVEADDSGFVARPDAPGEFEPDQVYAGGVTVSVEGQYFSPVGRADALAMRKRLSLLYNNGRPITMTVADDLETTTRRVTMLAVRFPWTIHQEFAYTLDMRSADPRRYGSTNVVETGLAQPSTGLDFGDYDSPTNRLDSATLGTLTLG